MPVTPELGLGHGNRKSFRALWTAGLAKTVMSRFSEKLYLKREKQQRRTLKSASGFHPHTHTDELTHTHTHTCPQAYADR